MLLSMMVVDPRKLALSTTYQVSILLTAKRLRPPSHLALCMRRAPREKLLADRTPVAIAVAVAVPVGIVVAAGKMNAAQGRLHCCSV